MSYEFRLDSGSWQATASTSTGDLTVGAGAHTITVRATDGTGALQTSEVADVVPDGATGWHSVSFTVA